MHLSPADQERLLLAVAGMVARDRRERGVRLNHPEALALLSTWVIERAREGASVPQLMDEGRRVLTTADVMPGVAEMIDDVQVEATFADGRKLVTLHHPIGPADDDEATTEEPRLIPGEVRVAPGTLTLNAERADQVRHVTIENTGDRPVQIGSHLHLADANNALAMDRELVRGRRLDVPSGTSVRFEPGVTRTVATIPLGGRRAVPGIQRRTTNAPERHDG